LNALPRTTGEIVKYLRQHEKVETLLFPFDEGFPQYQLAKRQMSGAAACSVL
jgi:cystathionine beta-lyase/cystathionine gamma-synthase